MRNDTEDKRGEEYDMTVYLRTGSFDSSTGMSTSTVRVILHRMPEGQKYESREKRRKFHLSTMIVMVQYSIWPLRFEPGSTTEHLGPMENAAAIDFIYRVSPWYCRYTINESRVVD